MSVSLLKLSDYIGTLATANCKKYLDRAELEILRLECEKLNTNKWPYFRNQNWYLHALIYWDSPAQELMNKVLRGLRNEKN